MSRRAARLLGEAVRLAMAVAGLAIFIACAASASTGLPLPAEVLPAGAVVAPVVASPTAGAWMAANWPWVLPLAIVVLSSLATGLSKYPRAGGVVTALRVVLDVLSVVTHKDSPGSLSVPGLRSRPPGPPDLSLVQAEHNARAREG